MINKNLGKKVLLSGILVSTLTLIPSMPAIAYSKYPTPPGPPGYDHHVPMLPEMRSMTVEIKAPNVVKVGEEVKFEGCIVNGLPIGDYTQSYKWNFGDGNTSSDWNPVHSFNTPGTYVVKLNLQKTPRPGCYQHYPYPTLIYDGSASKIIEVVE